MSQELPGGKHVGPFLHTPDLDIPLGVQVTNPLIGNNTQCLPIGRPLLQMSNDAWGVMICHRRNSKGLRPGGLDFPCFADDFLSALQDDGNELFSHLSATGLPS